MAVELTETSATFVGTGISSTYSAQIYAINDDQIKVYVDNVLKTIGDDYVLNGLGASTGISIVAVFPLDSEVYVERATPIVQDVDTQNNETILEDVLDAALDKLTMMIQERAGETARAILVPRGEQGITLAAAADSIFPYRVLGRNPITGALMELDLPSTFRGDPGGNAMAIGRWASFTSLSIPSGTDQVQTDGYVVRGWGQALYVLDEDQVSPTATVYRRKSANNRWFRLSKDQPLALSMFGAAADGATDDAPAFTAAFAFGQFPVRIEKSAQPYRFVTSNMNGIAVPSGAIIDARGAEIKLDATGLPDDFRYAFNVDNCQFLHWIGGTFTRQAVLSGFSFGGGNNAGRIRLESILDKTRGPVFMATPIAGGTAATITATSPAANSFTIANHGLADGELISLYRNDGANSLYAGLETHRDYYAITVDADTFKVGETKTLALDGVAVDFSNITGAAPDRIRKGLVPSKLLEIVNYRCEDAGGGPHVFGMWERVYINNLSGHTQSVQLFQHERPGGGVWLAWGYPFISVVEDVYVEASALGGVEWTHCHEIYAKRVRVEKPNRLIDGTLWGFKPEAPAEPVAYAGISIGARTRIAIFEDCFCEGAPYLPNTGPRSAWPTPTDSSGWAFNQPGGKVSLIRCGGMGNSYSDINIFQTAGDGYTKYLRRSDRVTMRDMRCMSSTPLTVSPLGTLPPIDSDGSIEAFGRNFTSTPAQFALQGWNTVGPDGAISSWFDLGANVTVDTADKKYGFGSVKYRGAADGFAFAEFPLDTEKQRAGNNVIVYALLKVNGAKFPANAPPTFIAAWDDEVDPEGIIYSFFNIGSGEYIADEFIVARAVVPSSATSNKLRIYPHFAQAAPVVADPDWYFKIEGVWIWTGTNGLNEPGIDIAQPMTTNGEPTLGTHPQGQEYRIADPAAAGNRGYVCTVAGAPGTWKTFGEIAA
jgi:hypothetical protein